MRRQGDRKEKLVKERRKGEGRGRRVEEEETSVKRGKEERQEVGQKKKRANACASLVVGSRIRMRALQN